MVKVNLIFYSIVIINFSFFRLVYFETSALTGQNVTKAVETLLELIMIRMESTVDRAMLPMLKNRADNVHIEDATNNKHRCQC